MTRPSTSRLLIVAVLLAFAGTAVAKPDAGARVLGERVRGGGDWATAGRGRRDGQRWQIDLSRAGDKLVGTVALSRSPLAARAQLEATIDGSVVRGRLHDERGELVATITGEVAAHGITGTYVDRSGERGEWWWRGVLPR